VRIRIALTTAVAVIVSTGAIFTLLGSSPAASARITTHRQVQTTHHHILRNTQLAFFHIPATVKSFPGSGLNLGGRAPTPAQIAPRPALTPATAAPTTDANSVYTADWMCIRVHESNNRYNDPSAPSGAYGILASTWHSFGFSGMPYQAAPIVQDSLALRLYNMYGFHPWSSRYACGL
jgi:hypothetical protein